MAESNEAERVTLELHEKARDLLAGRPKRFRPHRKGTDMTEREKLIRRHWDRYGFKWDIQAIGPILNIPVRHRLYPFVDNEANIQTQTLVLDKLQFEFKLGRMGERKAYRIECEGVVVEEGPL